MQTKLFILFFFLSVLFSAQSNCSYIETKPQSTGYVCEGSSLFFSNAINTTVKGYIYATDEVLIQSASGYGILILPADPCNGCTEPTTTTVGTKKNGGGKGKKNLYTIDNNNKELIMEKNPVDDLLRLSLSNGIIKEIIIFDKTGKQIKHKFIIHKTADIDVSGLPKGIYGVKTITDNNQTFTKQFIKN